MTRAWRLIVAGIVLLAGTAASAEDADSRGCARLDYSCCAGLDYSCEELVQLGFTYPFAREPGSYLFVNGVPYPYVKTTDRLLDDSIIRLPDATEISVRALLSVFGLEAQIERALTPVIGYGSDPAAAQLRRKFSKSGLRGPAVIPVMKGQLRDYDIVWSPFFVGYGAMPSTIAASAGTAVEIWVTWLEDDAVRRMNQSEGAGELYAAGWLRDVHLTLDGPDPKQLLVYVSCYGALTVGGSLLALDAVPATNRSARPVDSAAALRAVLPILGWRGSVFDLIYANVTSPSGRVERTDKVKVLGRFDQDPHFHPTIACGSRKDVRGGRF
jgi:hypothetical protein